MSRWVTRSKLLWYALAALLLLMAFRGQAAVPRQQPPATAKKAAPAAQRAPTPQRKPAPAPRKMAPAKPAPQKLPPVATETKPSEADPAEVQAPAPAAGPALSREEKAFYYDLSMLLAGPHRLSGSRPNAAAAEYIAHQLKSLALDDIFFLDMPVWQTVTERCELIVEGELIPLWPVHPNISVPPVTPPEGISGALVYVGAGEAENYGDRSVEGKIVVLDYDSFDNWHRAFVLGAKAVIFLGNGSETPPSSKYSGVPKNQIRLYASTAELHGVDLRVDHDEAILKSKVVWRESQGRNIIARIRGTAPDFSPERIEPEAVVLSTHYDSFGVIPELAPGARGAANVAALLETAQKLKSKPPKRDVILLFLDNDARGNQGAREVYEALEMPEEKAASLTSEHQQELSHVSAMRDLLLKQGLGFAPGGLFQAPAALWLKRKLQDLAGQVSDDIKKELELLRFVTARQEKESGVTRKRREFLETTGLRWDEVRRALHEDKFGKFVVFKLAAARGKGADAQEAKQYQKIFVRLRHDALGIFDRRMAELRDSIAIDRQRNLLREAMASSGKKEWVVLHVEYNLSDGGPTWGVVVSDWNRLLFPFRPARTDGDAPGYYGPVLNAFNDSAKQLNLKRLDVKTFTDPDLGLSFAPGPFISAGNVAGEYGLYNVSIMTGYDRRLRDGHPADRLESLDWRSLREQGIEATALIEGLADSQSISLPRVFKAVVGSHYPTWEAGKAAGNYVGIQVSGSLKEDRPAAGAVLAVWPVSKDANPVGQWT
ncbi:MAG TPA: M28 family metallopeptidase, partial [Polyangiaceae bacterium]